MTMNNDDYFSLFSRHMQKCTEYANDELRGNCPFHDDRNPSFTANRKTGLWRCFGCGLTGNAAQFAKRVGERHYDDFGPPPTSPRQSKIIATYSYRDEHGKLLHQTLRFEPKHFSQRRPDGAGGWINNLADTRRVLYKLPEILEERTVYLVEGEKDADRLWSLGIPATTSAMGAKNWREEYAVSLTGTQVVILPDNDEDGEFYTRCTVHSLLPVCETIQP